MTASISMIGDGSRKVPRRPSLDRYDNMSYRPMPSAADTTSDFGTFLGLERDYPSTHDRDRDLLIALGVDGNVPLAQARVNMFRSKFYAGKVSANDVRAELGLPPIHPIPANDNHELAAQAA